jgi:hypothetical protein
MVATGLYLFSSQRKKQKMHDSYQHAFIIVLYIFYNYQPNEKEGCVKISDTSVA